MKKIFLDYINNIKNITCLSTEPNFRFKQILDWIFLGVPDFLLMKNIPLELRKKLNSEYQILPFNINKKLISKDNQTIKWLLNLKEDEFIECVLMKTNYGNTVCISSEVGCAMGCKFCASTLLGLKRKLNYNEMFAQLLLANWEVFTSSNDSITHIVVMGTGEPLNNIENLINFIELAHNNLKISYRRITVSTCGIIEGIKELTKWNKPINLALSLHAPNNSLRSEIMPINNKYKIEEVLEECFNFSNNLNRQLMIEYILLTDKNNNLYNSKPEHALELSQLLKNKNCMVNLIPWNCVNERNFNPPSNNIVHKFQKILTENGIHTRIRKERGQDINSACGQLRINPN